MRKNDCGSRIIFFRESLEREKGEHNSSGCSEKHRLCFECERESAQCDTDLKLVKGMAVFAVYRLNPTQSLYQSDYDYLSQIQRTIHQRKKRNCESLIHIYSLITSNKLINRKRWNNKTVKEKKCLPFLCRLSSFAIEKKILVCFMSSQVGRKLIKAYEKQGGRIFNEI